MNQVQKIILPTLMTIFSTFGNCYTFQGVDIKKSPDFNKVETGGVVWGLGFLIIHQLPFRPLTMIK